MAHKSQGAPFTLLKEGESRLKCFGAGFGLECAVLALLIWVPLLFPQKLEAVKTYWMTPITAPPVVAWKPQPVKPYKPAPVKRPELARETPKPDKLEAPPKPRLFAPVFSSPIAHAAPRRRVLPADAPEVARAFSSAQPVSLGSSAIPTLKRPRPAVQTGGFGDPEGLPPNGRLNHSPNIAQLGSYDLPNGPGYGNGTGGARGARGVVASAGFGNGVAIGGSGNGHGGRGTVKAGLFADESRSAEAPRIRNTSATIPKYEPVEILYKPRPAYTLEARQKKIEGEVLLEVVFTASGRVQVLRTLQGLGYGLDETAEAAARKIQFRPARQGGEPVDSTATVHIVFQLAY